MYTLMSDVIRKNKARYYQISQVHADVRLAMFIQDLSRRFSLQGYSPQAFRLLMARGDIANYLAMVPETISRKIKRLEKGGIIRFSHRFITVQSPEKLNTFISQA
ncbi:helix-turn-helix domain-containing protein [Enterobacter sp. CGMCC 5087]|uniref:helix-turn-helix domain-containing protein n=1 Tax=Enterobacter sp. CGMCC 5087 TaxID=2183878 RepID=UPI0015E7F84B|nr:helix-turn-helix domain-containing protein [Enterobacter sp. CGMCC 5087]